MINKYLKLLNKKIMRNVEKMGFESKNIFGFEYSEENGCYIVYKMKQPDWIHIDCVECQQDINLRKYIGGDDAVLIDIDYYIK